MRCLITEHIIIQKKPLGTGKCSLNSCVVLILNGLNREILLNSDVEEKSEEGSGQGIHIDTDG